MTKLYEIFTIESEGIEKSAKIDLLLGYKNAKTNTDRYRLLIKKHDEDIWAGVVCDKVVSACASMPQEERAEHYVDSDLKSAQWLKDNDWEKPY